MPRHWTIDDHGARPGPMHWSWRCLTCSEPVSLHAPWPVRIWRRFKAGINVDLARIQLLALADELDQVAQRKRDAASDGRDRVGGEALVNHARGFEAAARMARERASRL